MKFKVSILIFSMVLLCSAGYSLTPWPDTFDGATTDSIDSSWTAWYDAGPQGYDGSGNWVMSNAGMWWGSLGINRLTGTGDLENTVTISTIAYDASITSAVRVEIWDIRDTVTWNWDNVWHGIMVEIQKDQTSGTEHIILTRRNGSDHTGDLVSDVTTAITFPLTVKINWTESSKNFTVNYGLGGALPTTLLGTVSDYTVASDTTRLSQLSVIRFPGGATDTTIAKFDNYNLQTPTSIDKWELYSLSNTISDQMSYIRKD